MEDHVVSGAYSYIHSSAVNALGCESGAYPGNTGIHTLWENSPLQGIIHISIHSKGQFCVARPPTGMLLGGNRKMA